MIYCVEFELFQTQKKEMQLLNELLA